MEVRREGRVQWRTERNLHIDQEVKKLSGKVGDEIRKILSGQAKSLTLKPSSEVIKKKTDLLNSLMEEYGSRDL